MKPACPKCSYGQCIYVGDKFRTICNLKNTDVNSEFLCEKYSEKRIEDEKDVKPAKVRKIDIKLISACIDEMNEKFPDLNPDSYEDMFKYATLAVSSDDDEYKEGLKSDDSIKCIKSLLRNRPLIQRIAKDMVIVSYLRKQKNS